MAVGQCRCGELSVDVDLDPRRDMHLSCYCDDCRAYHRWLGAERLLDRYGGAEIVQVAPAELRITQGDARLACVRLSEKGLLRFYASCCRTPIGNTVRGMPFIGLSVPGLGLGLETKPLGIHGRLATSPPPGAHPRAPLGVILRTIRILVGRRLRGKHRPSPFLRDQGEPRVRPEVLTASERDALRAADASAASRQSSG